MGFKTKLQTLLGFHQFFPLIFSLFQEQIQATKVHSVFRFPQSPLVCEFLSLSLLVMILSRVLVRLSCKMSHTLSSSDIFLMIRRELWDFEKNIRSEVLFSCNFVFILCDIC